MAKPLLHRLSSETAPTVEDVPGAPAGTREEVAAVARRRRRWRRRTAGTLAVLVIVPILGVAILWPLTPGTTGADQLVRAHLAATHSPELVALPTPDRVGQALIATEDSRFLHTLGIDPVSVVRWGVGTVTGSGDTGGATLE